jgi:glycosyltransferase involved in cell wall biosynthesis
MNTLVTSTPADPKESELPIRILAFAYSCSPDEGSEPGAGWTWTRLLARLGEVWVVTRENNREAIERGLEQIPEGDRMHPVYVDLPPWGRFWKRGHRGTRAYYQLWQSAARRRVRAIPVDFDLVWHLTLANAWLGSPGPGLGKPFVYGPVGGGVAPPVRLLPSLGARGVAYELLRAGGRAAGRYGNPRARSAWRGASLILAQNEETRAWLPERHRAKVRIVHNAVLDVPDGRPGPLPNRTALFAARLLPWKGGALALRAIAEAPGWTLLLCGDGPDAPRLRRLANQLQIEDRVRFLGKLPREAVLDLMNTEAGVLLHPSLHDDAPLVVAEAAVRGLPVVCLARGGPPLIAGPSAIAVPADGSSGEVVARLARALQEAGVHAVERNSERLTLDEAEKNLRRLLSETPGLPVGLMSP